MIYRTEQSCYLLASSKKNCAVHKQLTANFNCVGQTGATAWISKYRALMSISQSHIYFIKIIRASLLESFLLPTLKADLIVQQTTWMGDERAPNITVAKCRSYATAVHYLSLKEQLDVPLSWKYR